MNELEKLIALSKVVAKPWVIARPNFILTCFMRPVDKGSLVGLSSN